jgi:hypothetical protein
MVPIVNPSPGQTFRSNPTWINQHRELIVSDAFLRATDYGFREYASLLAKANDSGNAAMAMGFKIQGALEFLKELRKISETPRETAPVKPDQLDHTV